MLTLDLSHIYIGLIPEKNDSLFQIFSLDIKLNSLLFLAIIHYLCQKIFWHLGWFGCSN